MRPWSKRAASRRTLSERPSGTALVDAASSLSGRDAEDVRAVAFAVAQATRDGDPHALSALSALLAAAHAVDVDTGALVNALSALQFAAMLPDEVRADWAPPSSAVAEIVGLGLDSDAHLEQTIDLLWALVNQRVAADWLGAGATALASRVASSELGQELVAQARMNEPLISLEDWDEYPRLPARSSPGVAR